MYDHLCSTSYHTSSNAFDLLPQRKQSAKLKAGGWKSARKCYLFTLKQCVVLKRNLEYSGRSDQISPEGRQFYHQHEAGFSFSKTLTILSKTNL
jgi:hypothetical protein